MSRARTPTCPKHPAVTLRCPACVGSKGGRVMSPEKLAHLRLIARLPRKRRKKTAPA